MSHIEHFELDYYNDPKNIYEKKVVICQVFPDTTAYKTQVLKEGHIIDNFNDISVKTLDDIRQILRTRPDDIRIETRDKNFFMVSVETVISEDKKLMKNFGINHNYLLEN